MTVTLEHLDREQLPAIATTIRNAGIAGAGGAGFPTHAKWERLDEVSCLLVNHQESEPNYYIDKWLGRTHAEEFARLFGALTEEALDLIVVCAKEKDREEWMGEFEAATDATVLLPDDLPLDPAAESGVVVAYTDNEYEYGMESVLLRVVADVRMRDGLPMDHGWIVQNTETMWNVYRTLEAGESVTRKLVHVDGNVERHRFLDVPVGTPAAALLEAAGRSLPDLGGDELLTDGGPGWCFEIEDPAEFGVTKRTNCLLVLSEDVAEENTLGNDRINVLDAGDWTGDHETEPTSLDVDRVRVPLLTNPSFGDVVAPARPVVAEGDEVTAGEMIAVPDTDGISNTQHASIDGTVTAVTDAHVEIHQAEGVRASAAGEVDHEQMTYWTQCGECGTYVPREADHPAGETGYVCAGCR